MVGTQALCLATKHHIFIRSGPGPDSRLPTKMLVFTMSCPGGDFTNELLLMYGWSFTSYKRVPGYVGIRYQGAMSPSGFLQKLLSLRSPKFLTFSSSRTNDSCGEFHGRQTSPVSPLERFLNVGNDCRRGTQERGWGVKFILGFSGIWRDQLITPTAERLKSKGYHTHMLRRWSGINSCCRQKQNKSGL